MMIRPGVYIMEALLIYARVGWNRRSPCCAAARRPSASIRHKREAGKGRRRARHGASPSRRPESAWTAPPTRPTSQATNAKTTVRGQHRHPADFWIACASSTCRADGSARPVRRSRRRHPFPRATFEIPLCRTRPGCRYNSCAEAQQGPGDAAGGDAARPQRVAR